jgi:hypothetical protein
MVMENGRKEIEWSPRVSKASLRRLYEGASQGLLDEELLAEVGTTLLARCRDILTVHTARSGRVRCPRCERQGRVVWIKRRRLAGDPRDELMVCAQCGWQLTWGEYCLSFKRRQLNSGGALEVFAAYIDEYEAARSSPARLLAIDRLIHAFHYSLADRPDLPCRPVGCNLIQGRLSDVLPFLDELSGLAAPTPERQAVAAEWQEARARYQRDFIGWLEERGRQDNEDECAN